MNVQSVWNGNQEDHILANALITMLYTCKWNLCLWMCNLTSVWNGNQKDHILANAYQHVVYDFCILIIWMCNLFEMEIHHCMSNTSIFC